MNSLINSYFFVPANQPRFLEKSLGLVQIEYRILDFEDSISPKEIEKATRIIRHHKIKKTDWARLPLCDITEDLARELFELGIENFVIPKTSDKAHADSILNGLATISNNIKFILLVENPKIYIDLEDVLKKWHQKIVGIGLGSHDFAASAKLNHVPDILLPLQLHVSLLAKAYNIEPIDIASMNLSNESDFNTEIQTAFNLGYRAKFIIHPFQLRLLNEFQFYPEEDYKRALEVLDLFDEKIHSNDVVLKHRGKIYEKPHIENLKNIKTWGDHYYGTNR